jgi:hypothetical protein
MRKMTAFMAIKKRRKKVSFCTPCLRRASCHSQCSPLLYMAGLAARL